VCYVREVSVNTDVVEFLGQLPPARAEEAQQLIAMGERISGFPVRLAGPGILGFGRYAYRYASGHAGSAAVIAFAPRKADLVLYPSCALEEAAEVLAHLGRHRRGKGCVYLRRLEDADPAAVEALFRRGMAEISALWPVTPQ
jgi:hypothetical protein